MCISILQNEAQLPATTSEDKKTDDDIDPVMKQYMDLVQQKRLEPQKQDVCLYFTLLYKPAVVRYKLFQRTLETVPELTPLSM